MNPLHPKTPVEILGRTFTLRHDYGDFAKAEGRLRVTMVGPRSADFWDAPDAYRSACLLYVGLMNCERDVLKRIYPQATPTALSFDDVAELFDFQNAQYLQEKVNESMEACTPKPEAAKGADPTDNPLAESAGTATTGTTSTPSAESTSV